MPAGHQPVRACRRAHSEAAAAKGVELIHEGKGELLMKGSLHTDELMRAVTSGTTGLRTARRISHVFIMDVPTYPRPLFITDAAINIFPDLEGQARHRPERHRPVRRYRAWASRGSQFFRPSKRSRPKIPSTIDAAALCKMAERGQITGGVLDGPLAFDNAIDPEAARIKGIKSRSRGPGANPGRAGSRSGKHARQEPQFPRQRRRRGNRARRARPDHSDFARRFPSAPAWRPVPSPRSTPTRGAARWRCRRHERHGHDPCRQCRLLEREVSGL